MDLSTLATAVEDAFAQYFEQAEDDLANALLIEARIIAILDPFLFFQSTVNAASFIKTEIPLGQLLTFK